MAERFVNPAPQLANGDFDLVPGGRLVFLETGTTAAKNVFADSGLIASLGNIVKLDGAGRVPNIWLDGSYKVRLHEFSGNPSFPLGSQLWERDPVGGDTTSAVGSDWVSTTIYSIESIVKGSDGEYYISIISSNQGNDPTSIPGAWSVLNWFTQWNTNQTYGAKENARGSDGIIYYSVTGSNLGNDPVTDDGTSWLPGGAEEATSAEVLAGVENRKYISPATASGGNLIDVQVFDRASFPSGTATWTKPAGTNSVESWQVGGGGGGGGGDCTTSGSTVGVGGGGGGGGGSYKRITVSLGATEAITIGAGGSAGSATNGTAGGNGTNSSFGAHATANGGAGGSGSGLSGGNVITTPGGAGGASSGDIQSPGGDGGSGTGTTNIPTYDIVLPGAGGDSGLGFGSGGDAGAKIIGAALLTGIAGNLYGGGGSGGGDASTAGAAGGAGADGIVIVKSYS